MSKPTKLNTPCVWLSRLFAFNKPRGPFVTEIEMGTNSSFALLIVVLIIAMGGSMAYAAHHAAALSMNICIATVAAAIAVSAMLAIAVADQWDIVLTLRPVESLQVSRQQD